MVEALPSNTGLIRCRTRLPHRVGELSLQAITTDPAVLGGAYYNY